MEITPIPCLTDNYAYIIYDNNSKTTGVVDPSESQPIISFLKKNSKALSIFVTGSKPFFFLDLCKRANLYKLIFTGSNPNKKRIAFVIFWASSFVDLNSFT